MSHPIIELSPQLSARFSVSLPNTDNASLQTEQLHELAILREQGLPGPWAFGLITEYLNRKHGHRWTTRQIVDVWKGLRQQYEKSDYINAGHVLVAWRGDWRQNADEVLGAGQEEVLREILKQTMEQFFEVMESELDNSSLYLDMQLEHEAESGVTVIDSVVKGFTELARPAPRTEEEEELWATEEGEAQWFRHPRSSWTGFQQSAAGLRRVYKQRAFESDMRDWKRAQAKGEVRAVPHPDDPKYKRIADDKITAILARQF
ncbi:MAG: hypothetical protein Q9221_008900 [Calogaya cf. arnoldii]